MSDVFLGTMDWLSENLNGKHQEKQVFTGKYMGFLQLSASLPFNQLRDGNAKARKHISDLPYLYWTMNNFLDTFASHPRNCHHRINAWTNHGETYHVQGIDNANLPTIFHSRH
jgi:hypothetical protein